MNPEQGHKPDIGLGRGRVLSRDSLAGLGRAAVSKNPVTDWAKGRMLTMVLTVLVLVWGLDGIIGMTVGGPGTRLGNEIGLTEGMENRSESETKVSGGTHAKEGMRGDLFKVAKPKKDNKKKVPKTNPVELLRLLELQGVLGGDSPRAIVFYKRTKETVTVSVGDGLGEFEVTEIRERSVILKWREELFELSL